MSRFEQDRAIELVERAHPRRMARHAAEWMRYAEVLDDAAARIEAVTARQHEIGGQTGPSMAVATALASDVLRVKARDLRRGGEALAEIADSTMTRQEEKRAIERDHPDDGNHVVAREDRSRRLADDQESALLAGIATMKSIQVGDDPRRAPITVVGPQPVRTPTSTWYPRPELPEPPVDVDTDPDEDDADAPATPQGPAVPQGPAGGGVPAGPPPGTYTVGAGGPPSVGSSVNPAALGAAALGGGGVPGAAPPPGAAAASGARPIGAGGVGGSGGVLGRSDASAGGGAAGRSGSRTAAAGGGAAGGRGGAAGAGAGGRGRRREREQGRDRDLHDDGEGWLDDEAGPDVLR